MEGQDELITAFPGASYSDRSSSGGGGGLTGINGQYADTWTYDGQTWAQIKSYYTPDPRWDAGMAYDIIHHRMVLFGGQYWADDHFAWRNDTWFLGGP